MNIEEILEELEATKLSPKSQVIVKYGDSYFYVKGVSRLNKNHAMIHLGERIPKGKK